MTTQSRLVQLLRQCTVRLNVAGGQGTGFFVAPGLILTCAHVVQRPISSSPINIFWKEQNQNYTAEIEELVADPNLDLALLRINPKFTDHPCVYFDRFTPELQDTLYIFGYPKDLDDYSDGDSATIKYEGDSFKGDAPLLKLKEGQIKKGFSGSPLLNWRTGGVCGIIVISRNTNSDLGGRAVPTAAIFSHLPELEEQNRQFHQQDNRWKQLLPRNRIKRFFGTWQNKIIVTGLAIFILIFIFWHGIKYNQNVCRYPISCRVMTGSNEYPTLTLSFLKPNINEQTLRKVFAENLEIRSTPQVHNNPVFESIERFRNESGNDNLLTKQSEFQWIQFASNQNGRTTERELKLNPSKKVYSQTAEEFEKQFWKYTGERDEAFQYAPILMPLQRDLDNANYTSIFEVGGEKTILQYPKLSDIETLSIKDDYSLTSNKELKDFWIRQIIKNNPDVRGFIAFSYPYVESLKDLLGECQFGDFTNRITPSPYVKFIDIKNISNTAINIESMKYQIINKDFYQLTIVDQRDSLFKNVSKETQEIGQQLLPEQHLLLPIEFGFDTTSHKNHFITASIIDSANLLRLSDSSVYVAKPVSKLEYNGLSQNTSAIERINFLTKPINFSKDFISKTISLKKLFELIPKRFSVGSILNIVSLRVDGQNIRITQPRNVPNFYVLAGFNSGSCPYLLVYKSHKTYWSQLGTVLYGRVTKSLQHEEIHNLGNGISKIKLEERDKEITYIDALSVLYVDPRNKTIQEAIPSIPKIEKMDGEYFLLHQGESIEIDLENLIPANSLDIKLKINGYYEILIDRDNLRTNAKSM